MIFSKRWRWTLVLIITACTICASNKLRLHVARTIVSRPANNFFKLFYHDLARAESLVKQIKGAQAERARAQATIQELEAQSQNIHARLESARKEKRRLHVEILGLQQEREFVHAEMNRIQNTIAS